MCGICGIYFFDQTPVDPTLLHNMTISAKHRGPDDEGYLLVNSSSRQVHHAHHDDTLEEIKSRTEPLSNPISADLGFGYRRLSILDLTANGHQPMCSQDKNIWIVFNGEIYNYIEIRETLLTRGYTFRSNTDTEIILAAYQEWGTSCLEKFNGMFAFSLWDKVKNVLFCARDRLGIKPFYYYKDNDKFIWASEIKQLLISKLIDIQPNFKNISNYIFYSHQNLDHTTFFKNIIELPPGHFILASKKNFQITKYWELNSSARIIDESETYYSDQFYDLFRNSVKLRMRSDVPIGVALSGGLDSSSIACMAAMQTDNIVNTFSVYYEDNSDFDEREYIEEVLNSGKFKPVYFTNPGTFDLEEIKKWIYFQDEPCVSASPFSAYHNYQNVKNAGVTVALNGQGADEILAGYTFFFKYYFLSLLKKGNLLKFISDSLDYYSDPNNSNLNPIELYSQIIARLILPQKILRKNEKNFIVNTQLYDNTLHQYNAEVPSKKPFKTELDNKLYETLNYSIIPRLLHWEDRNSMAFSVESRVPFLDHKLVEYLFQLPLQQKINGRYTKIVLRNAMKGVLPEKIRIRTDKIGFGTPTDLWTKGPLKESIMDLFMSQNFRERGIINFKNFITKYENEPDYFKKNEIWKLMSLELWFKNFIDKK